MYISSNNNYYKDVSTIINGQRQLTFTEEVSSDYLAGIIVGYKLLDLNCNVEYLFDNGVETKYLIVNIDEIDISEYTGDLSDDTLLITPGKGYYNVWAKERGYFRCYSFESSDFLSAILLVTQAYSRDFRDYLPYCAYKYDIVLQVYNDYRGEKESDITRYKWESFVDLFTKEKTYAYEMPRNIYRG